MKLIRKFLHSLTFVDYIVASILLLIVLFIVLFLRRGNTFIPITIKVTNPDVLLSTQQRPTNEYVMSFVKGDTELNELGQVLATVDDVTTVYTGPDYPAVYVKLNVKALYSPLKKQYSYKGKAVTYGQGYTFTFSNNKFEGIIVDFPGFKLSEPLVESTIKVRAQLKEDNRSFSDVYGVQPFIADAIKVGDEVKDKNGKTIVKVLSVDIKPAKRTVLTADGLHRVIDDPFLKDVTYTLELKVNKTSNKIFYQDYRVIEVGNALTMYFKNITIYPTITQILE